MNDRGQGSVGLFCTILVAVLVALVLWKLLTGEL